MRRTITYILFAIILLPLLLWSKIILLDIPTLRYANPSTSSYMKSSESSARLHWTSFEDLPLFLRQAIVVAEDAKFYQHQGIDFSALRQALEVNFKRNRYARGGSTITMQLARNLYLSPHKTMFRKLREIILAAYMEQILSKERILECYLNLIEFAPNIFGVENAAQHYFHQSLQSLNRKELAFLVAIIPSPAKWGRLPAGEYVQKRMNTILARAGYATPLPEIQHEEDEGLESFYSSP
ncbi:MAG: monofunctional biosynthetic peptidoglycan transglycosylase [Deltaproteobacteria bacterium CG_4_10_14_0_2_um_filter_43_8]|nr:MAG: monofunctional biosynthetic peptidoglycan transglycosylase [Deltaproteobacteria bacterium CG11_big_fil_rev_8_21_14_0_20_42_23]PJA22119.1 MAG: monofunctional biosynthetic peptidoglycan transglycosylase [Deltaproteobacteria bacterium CG_4_10_14_0_2_um_filter_43_8]PJC64827.1 MAG: monofunctional biosynthetic peptidoglycan transglycosylase [Deltaproteobacteria bacterium CG_4_9_14_0_2_um_filter_42_21]